jgi:hypothetical protein
MRRIIHHLCPLSHRFQSKGMTRSMAKDLLAAGLHRDWDIRNGLRNAVLYNLRGWSKARPGEGSGGAVLALDLDGN